MIHVLLKQPQIKSPQELYSLVDKCIYTKTPWYIRSDTTHVSIAAVRLSMSGTPRGSVLFKIFINNLGNKAEC